MALAQIASLMLQIPEPADLSKGFTAAQQTRLAAELLASGLLNADWDENLHPRTGTPPNPGRFAPVPKENRPPKEPRSPSRWPTKKVNSEARKWVQKALIQILKTGRRVVDGLAVVEAVDAFLYVMTHTELNSGEDLLVAQMNAAVGPPNTLQELQDPPSENQTGYELHHIVEQNPANIAKDIMAPDIRLEKFGRDAIDGASNLVWVPRFQHEQITGAYNSSDDTDPQGRSVRDVLKGKDFATQRAYGLEKLREFGVLR